MAAERPIFFTNTYGGKLDILHEFQALDPQRVRIYTCGPTVYSHIHIGNFRSFLLADVLRRVLEYNRYPVTHARNITDVGHLTDETLNTGVDRIEAQARAQNMTPGDIARYYTNLFHLDAARLNLLEPHHEPHATEYVPQMIELTQQLVNRGYAYPSQANVYYDVSKFPQYGALSGNTIEGLIAGARVEVGEDKRNPADFALWKFAGPDKIQRWSSPWGEGVPGWHIECSAMSRALLGEQIDFHTGGVDNIFPHHEDEIAQSEAASGRQFVRYWLHSALLVFGAEKMSKSLGNIYTVSDLVAQGVHPLAYRYFTYQAHYRTPLTFSWDAMQAAHTGLVRIWEAAAHLTQSASVDGNGTDGETFRERFHVSINRDLDLPSAMAVLHELVGSRVSPLRKLALLEDFDRVLALDLVAMGRKLSETTVEEEQLLALRAAARTERDWATSDRLREQLSARGLEVNDTAQGQRWVRKMDLKSGAESPA